MGIEKQERESSENILRHANQQDQKLILKIIWWMINYLHNLYLNLDRRVHMNDPTLIELLRISRDYCYAINSLTLFLMAFLTNRTLWGGADLPPLVIWLSEDIFNIFFNRGHVLDVNGKNPKVQPSTLKIVALRTFWKIINLGKNPKRLKIRYLEIRLFIQKRPGKFKPQHIGCSGFL